MENWEGPAEGLPGRGPERRGEGAESKLEGAPEWTGGFAVNEEITVQIATTETGAFPHAFVREEKSLAEQRGLGSEVFWTSRPAAPGSSPAPNPLPFPSHFKGTALSHQAGPRSSFIILCT